MTLLGRLLVLLVAAGAGCSSAAEPQTAQPVPTLAPSQATSAAPAKARVALLDRSPDAMEVRYVESAAALVGSSNLAPFAGRLSNWPIAGQISSSFGPRWGGFHTGLDIAAPRNTPVLAAAAGQVIAVGKPYLAFGDTATIVIVAHGSGFATMYVHLTDDRPPPVKVGQRVNAGDVIGYCGSTGFSTGPHLHFMTIVNGRAVDPIPLLP